MAKKVVYLAGSGSYGCLYDCVGAYRNKKDAINALIGRFDMGGTRRAGALRRDLYLDLNPHRDGASYCEVVEGDPDEWIGPNGEFRDGN